MHLILRHYLFKLSWSLRHCKHIILLGAFQELFCLGLKLLLNLLQLFICIRGIFFVITQLSVETHYLLLERGHFKLLGLDLSKSRGEFGLKSGVLVLPLSTLLSSLVNLELHIRERSSLLLDMLVALMHLLKSIFS